MIRIDDGSVRTAQTEATKEAQRAGIAPAKTKGEAVYIGRKPSFDRTQFETTLDRGSKETGTSEIARVTGLSRQTIYRIRDDVAGAEKSLAVWGVG